MTRFEEDSAGCLAWWRELQSDSRRADRAHLRRIRVYWIDGARQLDLVQAPEISMMWSFLGYAAAVKEERSPVHLIVAAAALAHVKEHDATPKMTMGRAMAQKQNDKPLVSDMRFKRLIRCETVTEVLLPVIQAIHLLGDKVPVGDLAASLIYWHGPFTRKKWAQDYWAGFHAGDA